MYKHFIINSCVIFSDTGHHASEIVLSVEKTQMEMSKSVRDKTRPPTDNQRPPTANNTPPSAMLIIKFAKVPGWPVSVTSSGNKIYVGLEDNKNDKDNLDTHLFQFDRELLDKRVFVKRNCSSTSL